MKLTLSPSKYDALSYCPCFSYPPYESDAASEGTLLHESFESGDVEELNDEQARVVAKANEALESLKTGWLGWNPDDRVGFREHNEERVKNSLGHSGAMDRCLVAIERKRAIVADLKTGRLGLIADAKESLQLAGYVDATFGMYPDLEEVMALLISPRTNELESHIYLNSDRQGIHDRLQKMADGAENPFKKPRVHDILCKKCHYLATCPAANVALQPAADAALSFPVHELLKPVADLDETGISRNLAMIDLLVEYGKARKPLLVERVFAEGLEVPGYSKREREGSAFVAAEDTGSAYEKLRGAMPVEDFLKCVGKVSLTKLAEALAVDGADSKAAAKREARQAVEDALGELVQRGNPVKFLQRSAKLSSELLLKGADL